MASSWFFFLSLLCFRMVVGYSKEVNITVRGLCSIGTTDENYICATIDWWPPSKCDYGQCPWALTSVLNLNLSNPVLPKVLGAFRNLRIRIGGSLEDQVYYSIGKRNCSNFKKSKKGLFGFSQGCLHMQRWNHVYDILHRSGVKITFGLNALIGRKKSTDDLWVGAWDSSNARDFINHTIHMGQKIDSWELGNELSGSGVSARVSAGRYGSDMITLKGVIDNLYHDHSKQPKILAPGGFFDKKWFSDFLQASGSNVVDAVTHHIYNLGAGVDPHLLAKIQDPDVLDNTVQTFSDVELTIQNFAPWAEAWVGEAGGAYNSGGRQVSNSFVNSFWYLDQLGMAAAFNHKVYCRQSLIGGNYGLLNTTTMAPNPDYYSALLWHRLMGKRVLSTSHGSFSDLRTYSHCSKKGSGIVLLIINLSNSTSFEAFMDKDPNLYPPLDNLAWKNPLPKREEYHLTAKDGNIQSHVVLLNGRALELTKNGDVPCPNPLLVDAWKPIKVDPSSIVFATLRGFNVPACL